MSTWVEMAEKGTFSFSVPAEKENVPFCAPSLVGRGTGRASFAHRLSRARLLYLCRREAIHNWLALSIAMLIVLAAPSVGSDADAGEGTVVAGRCLQATEIG